MNHKQKYNSKTEARAVKRDVVDSMEVLTKIIYSTFGLEEGDNLGSMIEPTIQDVQSLLEKVENLTSYYRVSVTR